jgi:hypothetical protein
MNYRKLRITWTVCCGIATVLLICLWVRSYQTLDVYKPYGHEIQVAIGRVLIDETWVRSTAPPVKTSEATEPDHSSVRVTTVQEFVSAGTGVRVPFWLPTTVLAIFAVIPWLPRRFTLRSLLIATTLVGVLLGIAVWLSR